MAASKFVQVGITALRDPQGNFLPAVPIYIEVTEETTAAEQQLCRDIGRDMARKMKAYIDNGGLMPGRKAAAVAQA